MALSLKANPVRATQKSGFPNFFAEFSSGFPLGWGDRGSPFSAMRTRPGINHPWIYSAITSIIESWVQCPWVLVDKRDPKKEFITDHPLLKLFRNPNPHMSGTSFRESIMWALLLPTQATPGGTAFIWGDRNSNFKRGDIPDELWMQGDLGVRPKLNAQKILQAWVLNYQEDYSPYDYGKDWQIDLQEIIRINFFNPYYNLAGTAPGYPLRASINQDAAAQMNNTALLENGGQARGVFTLKKPFDPAQMDEFRANRDKYMGGPQNAGKHMILPWEANFEQLNMSNEDMQYLGQLGWNRDTVMAVFKVSKFALQQYEDLNYATAKEAKRQLFEQSIIPKSELIITEFNDSWVCNIERGKYILSVDMTKVQALQDDMDLRVKRADILVQMGIPPLIALKMCRVPVDEIPEGAFPWLMENQSPNAAFQNPNKTDPAQDDDDETKAKLKTLKKKELTREDKLSISNDYANNVLDPGVKLLLPALQRFFTKQKNRTLDLIDEWAAKYKNLDDVSHGIANVSEFRLDASKEDTMLRLMMKPHYEKQAQLTKTHTLHMISHMRKSPSSPLTINSTEADISAFIKERLKFISVVNDTTFDGIEKEIADSIAASIKNELSVKDTAEALKENISNEFQSRISNALTIANTEMGAVSSFVQNSSMKRAGIEQKRWISSHTEHAREDHLDAEAQGVIPFDQVFSAPGLLYPRQSDGPADQTINCKCTLIPVLPDDEANG